MDVIFAKINLDEEGKLITRKDLINDGFDCEIFINEKKIILKLIKIIMLIYIFKKKYNDINKIFSGLSLLSSINLSNFNTNNVTDMIICSINVLQ